MLKIFARHNSGWAHNIAKTVQKQLPVFLKQNYVHIATADMNRRYKLVKQLADSNSGSNWESEVIKTYYEGGYDK